jgi:hypothetical protein
LEKKGAMIDTELFNLLREIRGELGFVDFNKTLMKMEVAGLIYVSSLTKGKRRVELVTRADSARWLSSKETQWCPYPQKYVADKRKKFDLKLYEIAATFFG